MKTHIGINGACGRMGQRIVQLAHEDTELVIGAALESPSHPRAGPRRRRGLRASASSACRVRTDAAARPAARRGHRLLAAGRDDGGAARLRRAAASRWWSPRPATRRQQKHEIEAAAHQTAMLMAPNMSLAVNVLLKLVGEAARVLADKGFDVEILERHHRFKKDSPSGTALHFAKIVQEAMGQTELRHGREGLVGERPPHEIGIHAIRVGDNVGEHTIVFSTLGETLELTHRAHARDCYVRGALQAAKFLANRPAGRTP